MFDATKAAQILTEAAGRLTAEAGCQYAQFFSISDPRSAQPLFVVVYSNNPESANIAADAIKLNVKTDSKAIR